MKTLLVAMRRLMLVAPLLLSALDLHAQGTAFTYQGRLSDGANAANGRYDLTFKLFTALSGPPQIGSTVTNANLAVSNGLFTIALDFGASFTGSNVWLELGVRTNGNGVFTTLTPRQPITPAPYAIFSADAGTVSGAVPATNLTGTIVDARLSGFVALLYVNQIFTGSNLFNGPLVGTNLNSRFAGNGGGLVNLNTTNMIGTIADARLSGNVALLNTNQVFAGSNAFTGALVGTNLNSRFAGNGGGLTNLNATNLMFTIADARLSGNVALLKTNQVFTSSNNFVGPLVGTNLNSRFAGDGGGLTNLHASNLVSIVTDAHLPPNLARLDASQTFSGAVRFTNLASVFAGTITEQKLQEELDRRDAENAQLRQRLEKLERLLSPTNATAR